MRALAAALALAASPALADLTRAAKVTCVPDTVTSCTQTGECTTRAASAADKAQLLMIDFAAKTVAIHPDGDLRHEGDVIEDRFEGGVRRFSMRVAGGGPVARMTLARDGRLTITMSAGGDSAEATCTVS